MNPWTKALRELSGFIEFGGLMDTESREFMAQLLYQHLYDPAYPSLHHLKNSNMLHRFPNWDRLFHEILEDDSLRELTQHNEDFSLSVARETLNWCKNTFLRFEANHPFHEESISLQSAAQHKTTDPDAWTAWLKELKSYYPGKQQNWDFYLGQVQKFVSDGKAIPSNRSFALLTAKILEDWKRLF